MEVVFDRYNHPEHFRWVDEIRGIEHFVSYAKDIPVTSFSFYCLNVLATLHNRLMSTQYSAWIKAPGVIGLACATLYVGLIALFEMYIWVMAAQISPLLSDRKMSNREAFEMYLSAGFAFFQTFYSIPTAVRMLINNRDVVVFNPLRRERFYYDSRF